MKNIILTGFMGTFKSSAGKLLAKELNTAFFDADEEIEKANSLSIPQIFEFFGETGFREKETQTLYELSKKSGAVIALGGGACQKSENMLFFKENSIIIELCADIRVIYDRIKNDVNRPLAKNSTVEKLSELYEKRKPLYKKYSDYSVDTTNLSPSETAAEIKKFCHSECHSKGWLTKNLNL